MGVSWFVNDPRTSIGFTAFLLWGSLWGMPLLFLVSGMSVRYTMRSRTAWAFTAERLGRLGIPFATGLVLLVPPMFYPEHLTQPGFHQSYWRFWLTFLNVPAIAAGLLPQGNWTSGGAGYDPAHLWFLYVLLVAFAWIIVRWHAPILARYPVLVAASFTATLVIYELDVRRYRITRLLFGMKPRERTVDRRPVQTGAAKSDIRPADRVLGRITRPI